MKKNKKTTAPAATGTQSNATEATLTLLTASEAALGVGRCTKQVTFGGVRSGQWSVRLSEPYGLGLLCRMMRIEQAIVLVETDNRARIDLAEPAPSTGQLRGQGFSADQVEFLEAFASGLKRPTSVTA